MFPVESPGPRHRLEPEHIPNFRGFVNPPASAPFLGVGMPELASIFRSQGGSPPSPLEYLQHRSLRLNRGNSSAVRHVVAGEKVCCCEDPGIDAKI